jgi:peroxiredoxin
VVINAKLKSYFILPAAAATNLLLIIAIFMAVAGEHDQTAWLGAAIAALPLPMILARLMLLSVERTSENLPVMLSLAAVGTLIAGWAQFVEGTAGWGPMSVSLAAASILALYVFWYSRFGRIASASLSVGSKLPDFQLPDSNGDTFRTADLAGSPAVLLFYRGNWCPLCMAQIKEIASRYNDLDGMGVRVVLISPQPVEQSNRLAAKYDLPFQFLIDKDNIVAELLGVALKNGVPIGLPGGYGPDTVLPTLIVTNASGTIVFSDQTDNYRVRPEPDVFLSILRRSGVLTR